MYVFSLRGPTLINKQNKGLNILSLKLCSKKSGLPFVATPVTTGKGPKDILGPWLCILYTLTVDSAMQQTNNLKNVLW